MNDPLYIFSASSSLFLSCRLLLAAADLSLARPHTYPTLGTLLARYPVIARYPALSPPRLHSLLLSRVDRSSPLLDSAKAAVSVKAGSRFERCVRRYRAITRPSPVGSFRRFCAAKTVSRQVNPEDFSGFDVDHKIVKSICLLSARE